MSEKTKRGDVPEPFGAATQDEIKSTPKGGVDGSGGADGGGSGTGVDSGGDAASVHVLTGIDLERSEPARSVLAMCTSLDSVMAVLRKNARSSRWYGILCKSVTADQELEAAAPPPHLDLWSLCEARAQTPEERAVLLDYVDRIGTPMRAWDTTMRHI